MTLHALYRLADLVAHLRQPADLYEPAVDAMIAATQADRASILVFDDAGVMRFKAWRRLSDSYRRAVDGHSPWTPDAQDAEPILVPDVSADPSLGSLSDVILAEGIRALAFIPIGHHGRLLGKFMVYYDQPHDFSELDLKIASMVTHYVAFGLDRVRAETEISELLQRERDARHEAEALNRVKDDFLAMLSHELRNPLNAITNAVSVLDQTSHFEGAPAKAQDVIRRQTRHLARLLDDLLDAAKVGRGHLDVRPEITDLRSSAQLAVENLAHRFTEKGQELLVLLPEQAVTVEGDPNRLEQVIANLLDNACKYTPPNGSIWLTVTVEADQAVLRVRDTGEGIQADRLPSLFDPLAQLSRLRARTDSGLGLGLGVVKRIVDLHSGTVEVRSEGAGTEFTVRLPLIGDVSTQTIEPKPLALKRQRFALIEDHDDGREALVIALQLLGQDVEAASSGEAGIELVQRLQPDFVLVDIGLPDVDGYEVARVLRARLGERMTLVALTGYSQQVDRTRSSDAGFDAHLVKPVAPEDLLRLLSD
jgi:signal transduction histidine kinase/CheY-like chemotaxis protein